jgi:hypothetical protein
MCNTITPRYSFSVAPPTRAEAESVARLKRIAEADRIVRALAEWHIQVVRDMRDLEELCERAVEYVEGVTK